MVVVAAADAAPVVLPPLALATKTVASLPRETPF
jgi:hypothetical protein